MNDDGGVWLRCLEPFKDVDTGGYRKPGDEWTTFPERADALDSGPLAVMIEGPGGDVVYSGESPWEDLSGRDLRSVFDSPTGAPVVACLNVWEDLPALQQTLPTWYEYVDRVVAVDGAYAGAPLDVCASQDGTVEFLRGLDRVELVEAPERGFWVDQVTKRNQYFSKLRDGEVAFVVDADEFVQNAEILRNLGPLDVGWVPYRKAIYRKPQNFPRLFAASLKPRYRGRHYWVENNGVGELITDCQTGAVGLDHIFVPIHLDNTRGKNLRPPARIQIDATIRAKQFVQEAEAGDEQQGGRESLRIAQVADLDAGMVVFRLHTAINATTPHTSVMATRDRERPYREPRQYELTEDRRLLRRHLAMCDVIHCHLGYQAWERLGIDTSAAVVIHHHGTVYRGNPKQWNQRDARKADVRLVSNPELLRYGAHLHFLPNPVPVARYRRLRERLYRPDPDGWFRVGHSPSVREKKGTDTFLRAIERLRRMGMKVRPVLIEDQTHAECLRIKAAECDAFFDSFWLGMQCSGIEAGAMGIPVIAGDEDNRAYYRERFGETPYVFVTGRSDLERAIEMLAAPDDRYFRRCADRVQEHVIAHHDYAAVAARYLDILDLETRWRRRLSLGDGAGFLTTQK